MPPSIGGCLRGGGLKVRDLSGVHTALHAEHPTLCAPDTVHPPPCRLCNLRNSHTLFLQQVISWRSSHWVELLHLMYRVAPLSSTICWLI